MAGKCGKRRKGQRSHAWWVKQTTARTEWSGTVAVPPTPERRQAPSAGATRAGRVAPIGLRWRSSGTAGGCGRRQACPERRSKPPPVCQKINNMFRRGTDRTLRRDTRRCANPDPGSRDMATPDGPAARLKNTAAKARHEARSDHPVPAAPCPVSGSRGNGYGASSAPGACGRRHADVDAGGLRRRRRQRQSRYGTSGAEPIASARPIPCARAVPDTGSIPATRLSAGACAVPGGTDDQARHRLQPQ